MKFVLVGPRFNPKSIKELKKLHAPWIAVDGGLDFIKKIGEEPLFAIGDWDSLKNKKLLAHADHITLPNRKDRNDLYYALEAITPFEPTEIHLFGFDLGRLDHELANLYELANFAEHSKNTKIVYQRKDETLHFIASRKMSLKLKKNQVVSFFSVGEKPAENVVLKGFEYEMKGVKLSASSLGLSNRVVKKMCQISVARGVLQAVVNKK